VSRFVWEASSKWDEVVLVVSLLPYILNMGIRTTNLALRDFLFVCLVVSSYMFTGGYILYST